MNLGPFLSPAKAQCREREQTTRHTFTPLNTTPIDPRISVIASNGQGDEIFIACGESALETRRDMQKTSVGG